MTTEPGGRPRVTLLVTDLDNTLWDWVDAWSKSFETLLERLTVATGLTREVLEPEIKAVHEQRRTAEYSWLLEELPSLQRLHPAGADLMEQYDDVMHAFYKERKQATRLYDGVLATLTELHGRGVPVLAYTESLAYWTERRIQELQLDGLIDVLYSAPDHDKPAGLDLAKKRKRANGEYGLRDTEHRHVPLGTLKPDPHVLTTILADRDQPASETVYVGDSLMKDVSMAQEVGVLDVFARYGQPKEGPEYELLRRVTWWSDADVARERAMWQGPTVTPTYTIDNFSELLDLFDFVSSDA